MKMYYPILVMHFSLYILKHLFKLLKFYLGIPNIFCSNLRVQPNGKYFKVIANSVQGLRAFLNELHTENKSVPNNLISTLEKFIREIEPEESNLIVLNNNSKIKLYKEWKSYPERYENEENKAISWEKKESKSIPLGKYYNFFFISLNLQDN